MNTNLHLHLLLLRGSFLTAALAQREGLAAEPLGPAVTLWEKMYFSKLQNGTSHSFLPAQHGGFESLATTVTEDFEEIKYCIKPDKRKDLKFLW